MEQRQEMEQAHTLSQRLTWLFRDSDTEFTRFVSAMAMFGWCVILLHPGSTFATSPAFSGLAWLFRDTPWGSETTWGVIAGGLALLTALSAYGAERHGWSQTRWRRLHALSLLLAMVWWTYIALSIWFSAPISTGVAGYGAIAFGSAWAFVRYMARHDVIARRV